jgi:hypothetical protein
MQCPQPTLEELSVRARTLIFVLDGLPTEALLALQLGNGEDKIGDTYLLADA